MELTSAVPVKVLSVSADHSVPDNVADCAPTDGLGCRGHHRTLTAITDCTVHNTLVITYNTLQGGPKKTGLFLKVDNFATVSGRNACDMSKI